ADIPRISRGVSQNVTGGRGERHAGRRARRDAPGASLGCGLAAACSSRSTGRADRRESDGGEQYNRRCARPSTFDDPATRKFKRMPDYKVRYKDGRDRTAPADEYG